MQGSTLLAASARMVQQESDGDREAALQLDLATWQQDDAGDRQRLGDPHTIVLESELVARLAARLRATPWADVASGRTGADAPTDGVSRALVLLITIFTIVHHGDRSGDGSSMQPRPHVLQTLLRQVCPRSSRLRRSQLLRCAT